MTEPRQDRQRDLDRFLTFIDAVVAIAITLMVLPLAEAASGIGTRTVGQLLRQHEAELLGFLLSFAVIARLWLGQHRIVSSLVVQTKLVTWLLLAWTLTIVFLPFPTALVAETSNQTATRILYIGTMTVSATLLALIAWTVGRDRSIRDSDVPPDLAPAVATAVCFVLALGITLAVPATSYYPLLLLVLADPAVDGFRRVRSGSRRSTHMGE